MNSIPFGNPYFHGSGGQRNAHSHNFKPLKIVGNYSENEKIIKQMGTVSFFEDTRRPPCTQQFDIKKN